MKLFKLTTLALMTVLSLTACDKASTETAKDDKNLLLDMTMESLKIPMDIIISSEQITAEQKACVEKIDLNSQKAVIKEAMDKAFTPEEIQQLNDFYGKPAVQKVTNYGREQLFKQIGLPIEETAEKPSEEDMKVVADFSQTEMGQKYGKFNLSEDAQSANKKVNDFIGEELKKCGLSEEQELK